MNAGDVVGHYRIIEPLGKGGMGEVFAAEDTRLHRRVALKILPGVVGADPDARQRFEREAQAIAALNHPGIVTIHSVEEHGGRLLLTMELVEGRPLGESIPRGGVPLDRLLRIGIDVADALAAAQQRGITHRDVKPANIMITASGRAKVLDFGLAKVHEAEAARASDDRTRISGASDLTGEGKIVGTVAYMSPEQAEGKPVDPRSDMFSLGVVLHEMATGEKPFKGDTNVSVLSSILKDSPPPITDSNPSLPSDLARIVRRCLAKDPDRRYQTAVDLRNELEDLKQDTASGVSTAVRAAPRLGGMRGAILAIVCAAIAIALTAWLIFGRGRGGRSIVAADFTIDRLSRLTSTGTAFMAAISPDGRYVVHVKGEPGGLSLWTRQTATTSDVRIVPPSNLRFDGIAFSPDGNYVYYSGYPGDGGGVATLYRVPVLGGTSTPLVEDVDSPVTFSPDGRAMAFMRGSMSRGTTEVMVSAADGSNVRALAHAPAPDKFLSEGPAWSPDGRTILAAAAALRSGAAVVIYAVDTQDGSTRAVGESWAFARDMQWLPDGQSFLVTAVDMSGMATPQIWRVSDPAAARTRVTNDLNAYLGASLSADGKSLATVQTEVQASIYVIDKSGSEPRRVTSGARREDGVSGLAWLPDGRIVFSTTGTGLPQLWITDVDGQAVRQLTSTRAPSTNPSASPDGKWIYFHSYAAEGFCLFRIAPDGTGLQQITRDGDARNPIVSRDGAQVYFMGMRSGSPKLMKVAAGGGTPTQVSDRYFRLLDLSPDGTELLGVAWHEQQRRAALALLAIENGTISLVPDLANALFLPDGNFAIVARREGRTTLVSKARTGGASRAIADVGTDSIFGAAIARDGRIAISRGTSSSDVVLIRAK
jgi:Tol biopolymer transport system component